MSIPNVTVNFGNSNLGIQAASAAGTFGLVAAIPEENTSGFGVAVLIKSVKQAKTELANSDNAAILKAISEGFYGEVSEGSPLYCIFLPNTTNMEDMIHIENTVVRDLKNFSGNKLRAIGAVKFPDNSYEPTITQGFDQDIHNAVIQAQLQADLSIQQQKPIEMILQGYGATIASAAKDYTTTTNKNVHIVVGSEDGNSAISVLRALGQKASKAVQKKIGRVKSGSLKIADNASVYVGTTDIKELDNIDLATYNDKGYIVYIMNEDAPGFIFSDDVSLTDPTSDYATWSHNAVLGEAMRIAYATFYKTLKDDVDVDDNGQLGAAVETNLSQDIIDAINKELGGNISGVNVLINPDTTTSAGLYAAADIDNPNLNLTQSGKLYVFLTIRPKGYIKDVLVVLGFGL